MTEFQIPEETLHQLRMVDSHTFPRGNDDLHQYIRSYIGYSVPRVAVCPNHIAPFKLIADVFFERETNIVVLANRSGGKTRNLSILNHLNAIHKPLFEIANIGAIREQAQKGFSYLGEYKDLEWFDNDVIYSVMRETRYRNGSVVQVLSGTTSGVNSPHPLMIVVDETELVSWTEVLQEALSCAQSKHGYKAVQILSSTRKYASGNMYRLLVEKPREPSWPYKTYAWCLWEVLKRCEFPSCEQCKDVMRVKDGIPESWHELCHDNPEVYPDGKAKHSDGFYLIEDAWTKFTTIDYDIFNSQWLCLKPGRKGLCFASFDRLVHCKDSLVTEWRQRLHHDRQYVDPDSRELEIAVLMDMGWADPLAVLWVARDRRDNLFYFDSVYRTELDLRDLVPMILERFDKYNMPHDFQIWCDSSASRSIADLNANHNLKVSAIALSPDEKMRLLRKWLDGNYREGHPGICVDPETCEALCMELETLKLKLDKEGNPKSEMPEKGPNHLIDCAGYGFEALGLASEGVEVTLVRGSDVPTVPRIRVPTRSDWVRR